MVVGPWSGSGLGLPLRSGVGVTGGRWSCGFRGLGGTGRGGVQGSRVVSGQALLFGRGIHKKSCTPSKDEK